MQPPPSQFAAASSSNTTTHSAPQQPGAPPEVGEWILIGLKLTGALNGGPIAQHIAACPWRFRANQRSIDTINSLPDEIPGQMLRDCQARAVGIPGGAPGGTAVHQHRQQALQTMYSVMRLVAQAVVKTSPKSKLLTLMAAYSAFEPFHIAERKFPQKQPAVGWDTAVLVVLAQQIRQAAHVNGAIDDSILSDLIRKFRQMFLFLTTADSEWPNNIARRRGALVVLNCLLLILFHRGNLHQVKTILALVDQLETSAATDKNKGLIGPCGHIKSEVTKLFYFQGRVKLYAGQELVALPLFADCCARMPPMSMLVSGEDEKVRRNKLRCLFYLCVSSVLCGIAPTTKVMSADPLILSVIGPIVGAINSGSSARLTQVLAGPGIGPILRTRSVALHVQSLHLLCLLVVVKRLHALLAEMEQDNSRIDVECITKAVGIMDREAANSASEGGSSRGGNSKRGGDNSSSGDDTQTILGVAQLINNGWVKGYISFEHQVLVLSKKEPFPRKV